MDLRHRRPGWPLAIGLALAAIAASPASAGAATLVVNTTQDEMTPGDGLCSLREAIAEVNAPGTASDCGLADVGQANTITLGAQTYTLTIKPSGGDDNSTGDLDVAGSVSGLTISGTGPATVIDASGMSHPATAPGDRALSVAAGAGVTLSALTVTGGHAPAGTSGTAGTPNGGNGSDGGGIDNQGSLTLDHVTVSDNHAGEGGFGYFPPQFGGTNTAGGNAGAGGRGGGIYNTGTVHATASTITGNFSGAGGPGGGPSGSGTAGTGGTGGDGGGIYNPGTATLNDSSLSGNFAGAGGQGGSSNSSAHGGAGNTGGQGGGIYSSGTLTVSGSYVSANAAGAGGKGGGSSSGAGNGGNGGSGGGIESIGLGATLTVTASAISTNAAGSGGNGGFSGSSGGTGGSGGGVASDTGSLSLTNSTISANSAGGGGGAGDPAQLNGNGNGGNGGGINVTSPSGSMLLNVTVAGNSVGSGGTVASNPGTNGSGGGVYQPSGFCVVGHPCISTELQNTIVASDAGGNCFGKVTDDGHNLSFGDTTCTTTNNGDPLLGQLRDNGGPSPTMGLGPGSAARDQVPAMGAGCPMADQRGVPRPFGAACDIGAYEVAAPAVTTGPASAISQTGATISAAVTANAGFGSGGASVHFDYGLTSAYGSHTPIQTVIGVTPVPTSAALSGLTPQTTYHYRVVAGAIDGSVNGADQTFTTAAVPAPAGPTGASPGAGGSKPGATTGGGGGVAAAHNATPILAGLALSRLAFAAAPAGGSVTAARATGTTISYTDSEAATTAFSVLRPRPGLLSGRSCVAPSKRLRAKHSRRCTRYVAVGSFSHADRAGANRFHFTGRVNGHKLRPGSYRLSAKPRAGGVSGQIQNLSFRIIR